MGEFDRRGYMPTSEPEPEPGFSFGAGLARPLLIVAAVALVVFIGYKSLKSDVAAADASANGAQLTQIGQRLDELEHRLDIMEKKRKPSEEASEPETPSRAIVVAAAKSVPSKPQLAFSRPVRAQSAPSSPANSSPPSNSARRNEVNSERADIAPSQQQWEATADRLGNVVGELDSQRDAIERDQARLDELAGQFARNSQPFTLEKGSDPQQVGPVSLQLHGTDPKNQRYSMRLSLDDQTVELKDRALHEAIQFYAADGKLSFELVVSQIGRDSVAGRLVIPQQTASTR
jgi:hypothetical protein